MPNIYYIHSTDPEEKELFYRRPDGGEFTSYELETVKGLVHIVRSLRKALAQQPTSEKIKKELIEMHAVLLHWAAPCENPVVAAAREPLRLLQDALLWYNTDAARDAVAEDNRIWLLRNAAANEPVPDDLYGEVTTEDYGTMHTMNRLFDAADRKAIQCNLDELRTCVTVLDGMNLNDFSTGETEAIRTAVLVLDELHVCLEKNRIAVVADSLSEQVHND